MNTSTPAPEVVRFGEFVLDMRSGELASHGRRVLLSDQPFRLLAILIRERGNLVTRETLQHQLWSDDTFVDFEAGLNAAMKRLREALGDQAGSPSFVETLPRRGYRFIAHVEEGPIAQPPAARTIDAKAPEAAPPPTAPPRGRLWLRGRAGLAFALAGALVLTAAAALVVRVLGSRSTPGVDRLPVAEPGMTRVTNLGTVLKASLSPDGRDLAYVRGDGVQESLWVRHGDAEPTSLLGPLDGSFASLTFGPGAEVYYTFFSPDKTNMALYRLPLPGGPPVKVLDAAGGIAFSPDGSRYAYIHNRPLTLRESRVMLVDTRSASTRVLTVRRSPESFVLLAPGWSPDGTRLAVFGASEASPGRHEIISLEVDNGAARPIPVGDLAVVEGAVWLPGGRELIVAARERRASPQRLWSVSLGSGALRPLTTVVSDYTLVGVTGDGTHLLAIWLETTRSRFAWPKMPAACTNSMRWPGRRMASSSARWPSRATRTSGASIRRAVFAGG
jgi:DNA-binding winged helix-turn-helix (wHTH) protein